MPVLVRAVTDTAVHTGPAPTIYTVEDVLADPIALNSRLGTYTNSSTCSIYVDWRCQR
jgi:hypothetical protein